MKPDNTEEQGLEKQVDDIVLRCFMQGQYWGTASGEVDGEESNELNPDYEPEHPIDRGEAVKALMQLIEAELTEARKATGNTSDGYHTFDELYEYRMQYNAALFNEWAKQGLYDVHLSYKHDDGEPCFGKLDYFVVVAELPTGQISNHYKGKYRHLFGRVPERERANKWDGHTPQQVLDRLAELNKGKES